MKEELISIGNSIVTQDNRITDSPIFIVQKLIMDFGYDSDYADDYHWVETESGEHITASDHQSKKLDLLEDSGRDTGKWIKVFYKERWEFVTACFTEQGCKDYLKINGHNVGQTRIYADGSFRNQEFRNVRDYLISISDTAVSQ